jgi:hypothetical protein
MAFRYRRNSAFYLTLRAVSSGKNKRQIIFAPKHQSGLKQGGMANFMLQHLPLVPDGDGLNIEEKNCVLPEN